MPRVPLLHLGDVVIATVQEELHDHDAVTLQEDLAATLERTGARGVLVDLSVVETVDSFLGRLLNDMALVARLLGAHAVLVGIQPAVAIILVELGLELRGVRTALTVEKGLSLVHHLIGQERRRA